MGLYAKFRKLKKQREQKQSSCCLVHELIVLIYILKRRTFVNHIKWVQKIANFISSFDSFATDVCT